MASDVEKLVAKWRAEADQLRAQASRAQKRGDGTDLEMFQSAQDAESYADELEAALTQPAASGEVVSHPVVCIHPDTLAMVQSDVRAGSVKVERLTELNLLDGYVPLYATPQPSEDTARDAARYRWLLANGKPAAEGLLMRDPSKWSAAIDSAIKGEK